ncbi:MAG: hypothetical protein ACLPN5_20415 [Roseiarcus sp.]
MTILAASPAERAPSPKPRAAAFAAGALLALAVAALAWRLSPPGHASLAAALGAFILSASAALAATSSEAANRIQMRAFGGGALIAAAAALSRLPGAALEPAFGLGSLGLAAYLAWRLAAVQRLRFTRAKVMIAIAAVIGLLGYNAYYVFASRDLEIADFMTHRLVAIAVATLVDSGRWLPLVVQLAISLKSDYSWLPGLLPGFALALGAPLSRAVYQAALMAFYAAPALAALGWLSRELSVRAGLGREARRRPAVLAFAMLAAAAVYPTGLAVTARGLPDIGGLALYVAALALADRLVRVLALPRATRHAPAIALALALTLFAMFVFRRWYAFAAVGIIVMLGLEVAALAARRSRDFAWRPAIQAAALAALILVALVSPVLVDWAPDPAAHDYSAVYAAYRKPTGVLLGLIGDWWGYAILAAGFAGATALFARSRDSRLLRLTLGAAAIAATLFLSVQTPYVHHVFLIAPAIVDAIVAPLLRLPAPARVVALAALAAATLTPLGALAPKGAFPVYGQPHAPRQDLAELARMKDWIDAHARPDDKVCGLGSSYTFSGQLMDELWQLKADRSPLHLKESERVNVKMSDVDTVEGPPSPELKDCAYILTGDPVQTHLVPAYQQTVIVPSREMLDGVGIGSHYRRTGEVFHLEKGVNAVVFQRMTPLGDADMAALAERWRAARNRAR